MSVGAQRLREDHDRVRQGAIDKGEDPSVVDRAIELDVRRRELANEGDRLKAERNLASKRIGEAIRTGAEPGGGEVAELRAASTELGGRIDAIDAELAAVEGELDETLLRIPNPADPDVPVGGEEASPRRERSAPTPSPVLGPGLVAPIGSWHRGSTSSTTPAGRRSPARVFRSTRALARRCSAA